jgi:hypothetical protein
MLIYKNVIPIKAGSFWVATVPPVAKKKKEWRKKELEHGIYSFKYLLNE